MKSLYQYKDLPDDMQVLLFEIVERVAGEAGLLKLEGHSFELQRLPANIFPSVPLSTDYRDEKYALAMVGQSLPPVVLHDQKLIDGRHRLWALKSSGALTVDCINLNEIFPNYPYEPTGILS